MPLLIIIAGPNGSGKTTLTKYLVDKGRIKCPVINPDEIALQELGGYQFQVAAARTALIRRRTAIYLNQDVAFETTFSGQSEIADIKSAIANGYKVVLYFITLHSPLDNIIRVQERYSNLGHTVDSESIIRRYQKSKQNLNNNFALFDKIYLFDNSAQKRSRVAIFSSGLLGWTNFKHKDHPFFKPLLIGS